METTLTLGSLSLNALVESPECLVELDERVDGIEDGRRFIERCIDENKHIIIHACGDQNSPSLLYTVVMPGTQPSPILRTSSANLRLVICRFPPPR